MAYLALGLVSLHIGVQPFLTEKFIPRNTIKSSVICIQECVKTLCCFAMLAFNGQLRSDSSVFRDWTLSSSLEIAFIPAVIYCIQNIVAYYAYWQLDPLVFNLINQCKLISAAVFLRLILHKTPTTRQVIALVILFISSLLLAVDTGTAEIRAEINKNHKWGLIACAVGTILSGLAGTLTQRALQSRQCARNSYLFSVELACYGTMASVVRLIVENWMGILDGALIAKFGFFTKMEMTVLIPITVNAIGGIGIGLITKYLSVIHKSYATIFGILLNGVFRYVLYSTPMSNAMCFAVPMVMLSLWLNADPQRESAAIKTKKE